MGPDKDGDDFSQTVWNSDSSDYSLTTEQDTIMLDFLAQEWNRQDPLKPVFDCLEDTCPK